MLLRGGSGGGCLIDPGFAREPGMVGTADRAARATEKNGTALKAVVIRFDSRGDRASGLRTFDHDQPHVNLPRVSSFYFCCEDTSRLDDASCRCSKLGGLHRSLVLPSVGGMLDGRTFSNRPDPSFKETCTSIANLLAGSSTDLIAAERLPAKTVLAVQFGFRFVFTHGTTFYPNEAALNAETSNVETSRHYKLFAAERRPLPDPTVF